MPNDLPLPECVQMKQRIQAELEDRYRGMDDMQRRTQRMKDIKANPVLGPLYERLSRKKNLTQD